MTDTKNSPSASTAAESGAPISSATVVPAVVPERRGWLTPLVAGLGLALALVVGGAGGFAIAAATHAGDPRPGIQNAGANQGGQGPAQAGPRQGGPGGAGPTDDRPDRAPRPGDRLDHHPQSGDDTTGVAPDGSTGN